MALHILLVNRHNSFCRIKFLGRHKYNKEMLNLHFIHNKTSPRAMSRCKRVSSHTHTHIYIHGEKQVWREISDLRREIKSARKENKIKIFCVGCNGLNAY